jgi:DNA-binding NarL/FixJ family response regulator
MSTRDSPRRVGVLTVDDQPLFRAAAAAVVDATPGFETIGEAASGEEALRLASALHPDLVLLDVRMPGIGGIEAARRLGAAQPDVIVVLVSIEDMTDIASLVRSSGAAASLQKQALCPKVLAALWAAHRRR